MSLGYRDKLSRGRRAMAHLIHLLHERNGWSHRVLPLLSEVLDLYEASKKLSYFQGRGPNAFLAELRNLASEK